jgi:LuxR family maltose regulon positive regulatory protein
MALLGLAGLYYEWNDLDAADHAAQMAFDLGEQLANDMLQSQATLLLACSEHARGRSEQAAQRLAARLARLQPQRAPLLYRQVLARQAQLQLATGDLAAVQRWATSCAQSADQLPLIQQEQEALIIARLRIAQGNTATALALLEHWQALAQANGHIRAGLEILLLVALAHAAAGEIDAARLPLRQALAGAQAEGYQRLFLDEGDALAALLRALTPALREPQLRAYAQNLLLERSKGDLTEPLSTQERRVLALLADGRSNPQIAQELVVSVNTVKTQLKSIYRKLNVTSRQSAAVVARRRQLL